MKRPYEDFLHFKKNSEKSMIVLFMLVTMICFLNVMHKTNPFSKMKVSNFRLSFNLFVAEVRQENLHKIVKNLLV